MILGWKYRVKTWFISYITLKPYVKWTNPVYTFGVFSVLNSLKDFTLKGKLWFVENKCKNFAILAKLVEKDPLLGTFVLEPVKWGSATLSSSNLQNQYRYRWMLWNVLFFHNAVTTKWIDTKYDWVFSNYWDIPGTSLHLTCRNNIFPVVS